jgi:N-carbamoyl-L-amino-acid hydrolase
MPGPRRWRALRCRTGRCQGALSPRAIAAERSAAAQVATVGALRLEPESGQCRARESGLHRRSAQHRRRRGAARGRSASGRARSHEAAGAEGATVTSRRLARFEPVEFDARVISLVERCAAKTAPRASSACRRAPVTTPRCSHRYCPTAMIFVPSRDGLSHNIARVHGPGSDRGRRTGSARRDAGAASPDAGTKP